MYYLFTQCPNGDWELIVESKDFAYINRVERELNYHGIITGMVGW
jgi:hypothetical protein